MYRKPTVKDLKDLCNRMYVQKNGQHKIRIRDNSYDNYIVNNLESHRFSITLHI